MTRYRHGGKNGNHSSRSFINSTRKRHGIAKFYLGAAMLLSALLFTVFAAPHVAYAKTLAQSESAPATTPIPTSADEAVAGVAGRGGATLWTEDGVSVGEVVQGALLSVQSRSSDDAWLYVVAQDGTAGWVAAESVIVLDSSGLPAQELDLNPVTPESTTPAAESADTADDASEEDSDPAKVKIVLESGRLNIRKGPGAEYPIVAKALPGEMYSLVGETNDGLWYEIAIIDGIAETGWVSADYAAIDDGSQTETIPQAITSTTSIQASEDAASAKRAPVAGLSGQLVLQVAWGGDIYLYNLETGDLRPLTTGFDPSLSPDGTKVAFTRDGGENGVYVYDLATNTEAKVFGGRELLRSPKWSPDGRFIVFERGDNYILCKDDPSRCRLSAPSPDGTFPERERQPALARIAADGSDYQDLPVLPYASNPDWSRVGIVYQSLGGIQITQDHPDADTELVYFDIQKQYELDPDWQADGGTIVFQQRQLNHWELFAVQPDGSGLRAVTHPPSVFADSFPNNVAPAWSPDGHHIVFLSNRTADGAAGDWAVWVMDTNGGNLVMLPIELPFVYTYVGEQMVDWGP